MLRTTASGHVSNRFVNRSGATPGTTLDEEDFNNHQEEIVNTIEGFGVTLSPAENQLYNALNDNLIRYAKLERPFILSGLTISSSGLDVTLAVGKVAVGSVIKELLTGEATRTFTVTADRTIYVSLKSDGTVGVYQHAYLVPTLASIPGTLLWVLRSSASAIVNKYRHADVDVICGSRKAIVRCYNPTDTNYANSTVTMTVDTLQEDSHDLFHATKGILVPPFWKSARLKIMATIQPYSSASTVTDFTYTHDLFEGYLSCFFIGSMGSGINRAVQFEARRVISASNWHNGTYEDALYLDVGILQNNANNSLLTNIYMHVEFDL